MNVIKIGIGLTILIYLIAIEPTPVALADFYSCEIADSYAMPSSGVWVTEVCGNAAASGKHKALVTVSRACEAENTPDHFKAAKSFTTLSNEKGAFCIPLLTMPSCNFSCSVSSIIQN